MKPSALLLSLAAAASLASISRAAEIDMDAPHRALARENDVRIDAQLLQPDVGPGARVSVIYQIQNFSDEPVAIADRVADATYDVDSRTITLVIGSEVPPDGRMPAMVLIEPGEKVVLRGGAVPAINSAAVRTSLRGAPRAVRIKVALLRDVAPFDNMIRSRATTRLSDELFDRWFESNETMILNEIPVRWSGGRESGSGSRTASARADHGTF